MNKLVAFVVFMAAAAYAAPDGRPVYKESPRPYSYQYAVNDDYAGTNFNANENSDGATVKGSYQVHLPDGRVQTVTYTADHYQGYIADVKYDGKAQFPHQTSYKPAPPSYGHGRF